MIQEPYEDQKLVIRLSTIRILQEAPRHKVHQNEKGEVYVSFIIAIYYILTCSLSLILHGQPGACDGAS